MRIARDERGFTLVEVLLVCVVGMIIFGATLSAFTSLYSSNRAAEMQRDNVEDARVALDGIARQLRNLANPSGANPTIYRATSRDFIFQTSDPAKTWVRYCLDTTSAGTSTTRAKLWSAESTLATPPAAMTGTCGTWGSVSARIVTQNVSNVAGGMDRPIFTFACLSGSPVTCPSGAAEYPKITMVGAQLFVDANPNDRVHEMQVSTAVFLRNQNQAPVASVTTPPVTMGPHKVLLNGTGSSDPEGRTLDFHWYLDTAPPSPFNCSAPPTDNWDGPTFIQDFGAGATVGEVHNVWLVVCDPGGLSSTNGPISVAVPQ